MPEPFFSDFLTPDSSFPPFRGLASILSLSSFFAFSDGSGGRSHTRLIFTYPPYEWSFFSFLSFFCVPPLVFFAPLLSSPSAFLPGTPFPGFSFALAFPDSHGSHPPTGLSSVSCFVPLMRFLTQENFFFPSSLSLPLAGPAASVWLIPKGVFSKPVLPPQLELAVFQ